jgi:hypothetical protein
LEVFTRLGETPLRQTGNVVCFKNSDGLRAYPDNNSYHDFAEKRGTGDVIALVQNYLQTDFKGACTWLADSFDCWQYDGSKPVARAVARAVAANLPNVESKPQGRIYYPPEILQATQKGFEGNTFLQACRNMIPDASPEILNHVASLYKIGTIRNNPLWNGAATFPAIDSSGNVHTIQAKLFTPDLHTAKWESSNGSQKVNFIHSILQKHYEKRKQPLPDWLAAYQQSGAKLRYCLFGEHLLNQYPANIVGIVEAPKTAFIGNLYEGLPDNPDNILWLAVWSKGNLKNLLPNLIGRKVILFPDASPDNETFQAWERAAKDARDLYGMNIIVSDMLCSVQSKDDIADFWLKQSITAYQSEPQPEAAIPPLQSKPETRPAEPMPEEFRLLLKSLRHGYDKAQTRNEYAVRLYEGGFIQSVHNTEKINTLINEAIAKGIIRETQWQYVAN